MMSCWNVLCVDGLFFMLYCSQEKLKECQAVLAPKLLEDVDVTSDTNVFQLKLKDSLVKSLDFVKVTFSYWLEI